MAYWKIQSSKASINNLLWNFYAYSLKIIGYNPTKLIWYFAV